MLPFCGYNMADYLNHWFRRDDDGRFLWPGYGENSRVLKWVFERVNGQAKAEKTPIGYLPTHDFVDTSGANVTNEDLKELLSVDANGWKATVPQIREHYEAFGERLPSDNLHHTGRDCPPNVLVEHAKAVT